MIEQNLYAALSAITAVSGRVYPVTAPQDVSAPYITYQVINDGAEQCLSSEIYSKTVRIQVDIWSGSYSEAKSIKDDVQAAIVTLKGADLSAQDLYEPNDQLHRQLIDFTVKG